MSEVKLTKREIIKQVIEAGGATAESIMAAADLSNKALSSQFSILRLTGVFPVKDEDGVFSLVDKETWDQIQAEKKVNAKTTKSNKTPEEIYEQALERLRRAKRSVDYTDKIAGDGEFVLFNLKHDRALLDEKIAAILLAEAKLAFGDADCFKVGEDGLEELVYEDEGEIEVEGDGTENDKSVYEELV